METSPDGTWIAETPDGVVVARVRTGEVLVDRPSRRTFREPEPPEFEDGRLVVDGVVLGRVAPLPARLAELTGWYGYDGRRILLTQVPEAYFGEPMVLVAEGERVVRAYAVGEGRLLTEEGESIDLADDWLLRVTDRGEVVTLPRWSHRREEEVTFTVGDVLLAGTVILPPGPGPHPAAVLLHGAAGGQRDFCRLHADPILAAGVAVLIYDKAGHGLSGGREPSVFDQADAGEAAMRELARHPGIDPARIGLAGFSNGMWAVPMIAARTGAAFVTGVGSAGVSMGEAEVHRRTKVLRDAGVGTATVAAVGEAWRCIFAIVGEGATGPVRHRLRLALDAIAAAPDLGLYEIPDYVRENPMLSPIPPLLPVAALIELLGDTRDPEVTYDPVTDYAELDCPVFLQYGADDTSVPVEVSVERIRRAIAGAGRESEIRVYPGLEHMLNVLPADLTGLTPEGAMYQFHHFRYGQGVWAELTAWLRATVADTDGMPDTERRSGARGVQNSRSVGSSRPRRAS
ncbi:alpha/beta hydrolase family protein [Nocardioides bizhenqiangii]|uniref:Alpha/beta hydrolase n=1 Tax=Nocardioides bizhenqiangii TaxID=3095076 RepID=A0ABZ0ZM89_9ACTN|nr:MULTISPECIES: alpha/beta hydrolase [unclassified Nocardioides]MDZ5620806.1 alpha/beta hydrolase [Nocardioides sp. HM23]WQQ25170.1 alpha/beta hydrolase [Nocardioides sp. HM61]